MVEFFCVIFDYFSVDIVIVEDKVCVDFKDYLRKNRWVILEVVFVFKLSLRFFIVYFVCFFGKYKALEVFLEFGFYVFFRIVNIEEILLYMIV